jgi:hypothetical protein
MDARAAGSGIGRRRLTSATGTASRPAALG